MAGIRTIVSAIANTSTSMYNLSTPANRSTTSNPHEEENSALSPTAKQIFYTLYIIAIILGAGGNITSLIVFTRGRRCNTDIRAFLINLALADLMMAVICLPFSFTSALLKRWVFSKPMCPIILFAQILSVTVSVYTNTAISIDRFVAIRFPLRLLKTSRRHILWVIGAIWIASALLCAVQLWVAKAETENGIVMCKERWPNLDESGVNYRQLYTVALLIVTYIIPVMVIITMYSLVCLQLWFRATPGVENNTRDARQLSVKRKVVKMLMAMSTLFTLCWMPLHIFFLITDYKQEWIINVSHEHVTLVYFSANWLAMSNCFQNPIIYGFLNDNFRSDLAELLLRCCPRLSQVKAVQRAARANQPLHRLSTKMSLLSERGDSRGELYRNGGRTSRRANSQTNGQARTSAKRLLYDHPDNSEQQQQLLDQRKSETGNATPLDSFADQTTTSRSVRIKSATSTEEVEINV